MTRRDYILISNILRDYRPRENGLKWSLWVGIRDRFARELAEHNPHFDREQFTVATLRRKHQ